jgi:two-component system, NtrC family, sensor kinase
MRLNRKIAIGTTLITSTILVLQLGALAAVVAMVGPNDTASLLKASWTLNVAGVVLSCAISALFVKRMMSARLQKNAHLSSLEQVVIGVVREMGTPLNVITGRTAMLMTSVPEVREHTQTILAQASRLTAIIQRLLSYARPSSTSRRPLDLRVVTREALELVRPAAVARGIPLELEMPEHPVVIEGSPESLLQATCDLVMNGLVAAPQGSGLLVSLARGAPLAAQPGREDYVRLEVRRNNAVAPTENPKPRSSPALLQPETTANLALSLTIARDHGGFIELQQNDGQVSRLTVYLPSRETSCRAVS